LVRRLRSFACERSAAFRYEKPLLPPRGQGVAAAAAPDEESVEAEAGQQAPPLPPVHARASAP
jgi:hypothetical protein